MSWALEKKRGATVKGKKDCKLLQLDGEKLRKAVVTGSIGASRFAYTLIKMQAMRLDNMKEQLFDMTIRGNSANRGHGEQRRRRTARHRDAEQCGPYPGLVRAGRLHVACAFCPL